jgi:hypothetical protein
MNMLLYPPELPFSRPGLKHTKRHLLLSSVRDIGGQLRESTFFKQGRPNKKRLLKNRKDRDNFLQWIDSIKKGLIF